MSPSQARALTIAGSDSGGGAGIQADLKTFTCLEVYGSSVLTCVTSQNTLRVDGIHPIPDDFVGQQLDAVLEDIGTDAIKIGMLLNSKTISSVVRTLRKHYPKASPIPNLVLDPVMIATSGDRLLDVSAVQTLIKDILSLSFILTPNVPEAEALLKEAGVISNLGTKGINSVEDMKIAARELAKLGPSIILLKGGHLPFYKNSGLAVPKGQDNVPNETNTDLEPLELVDLVFDARTEQFTELRKEFIRTTSKHGTGCTLSSAIAAFLAREYQPTEAIVRAIEYVQSAIRASFRMGKGNGPVNHFHGIIPRLLELPCKQNPHPLKTHLLRVCEAEWKRSIEHPFVIGIADGTLSRDSFLHYLKQDYLFLANYARAFALGAYKSKRLTEAKGFANSVITIAQETKMHIEFCAKWGISFEDMLATPESMANVAYTRYVLDVGNSGGLLDLSIALAPCSLLYADIGTRLINDPKTLKGSSNPYWEWISNYAGEKFQTSVNESIDYFEKLAQAEPPVGNRLEQIEKIFRDATNLETAFWDMGLNRT